MEEDQIDNLNEIDTQFEKNKIEYRPEVNYNPDRPFTVNMETEKTSQDGDDSDFTHIKTLEYLNPHSQFIEFIELNDKLKETLSELELELQDQYIPLSNLDLQMLTDINPNLDESIIENEEIDFYSYRDSFDDPDDPTSILIQDLVSEYAEDVDGNIELELYEDVKEMDLTLQEMFHFYKEAIIRQMNGLTMPTEIDRDEIFLDNLSEILISKAENLKELKDLNDLNEDRYYELLRKDYGSPEFFAQTKEYEEARRPFDLELRDKKSTDEVLDLINPMLKGYDYLLSEIKTVLALGSDIDPEEVMNVLVKQSDNNEELAELLKLSQLSLKLQVNKHIQEKKQFRDVLKNTNNLSRKKRAHDELLIAVKLKNKMYLRLYDVLRYLDGSVKVFGTEPFLNELAGGLALVQEQYDAFIGEIYHMYVSENELRMEKINKIQKKEDARTGYTLVLNE